MKDGFTIVEGLLDEPLRTALAEAIVRLDDARGDDERRAHRSLGSLMSVWRDPLLASMFAHAPALAALARIGCASARATGGYAFRKPPGGPRTFWHQDWMFWSDPASARVAPPPQVGVLYALQDTTVDNGCLRVIPGSHLRRHALHDVLANNKSVALRRMDDPSSPAYARFPEEVSVPLRAGDAALVDARVLHAAHENTTAASRSVITLWYLVEDGLAPETRAAFADVFVPAHYPDDVKARLAPLLPHIPADIAPAAIDERGP